MSSLSINKRLLHEASTIVTSELAAFSPLPSSSASVVLSSLLQFPQLPGQKEP